MNVEASEAAVSRAVAAMLAAFGADIVGDARRVRACLTDELGSQARTRRAEIDAVVIAVEEGVAQRLRSTSFDRAAEMRGLAARGLDVDVASYTIDVWRHGLGLDGPHSAVPLAPAVLDAGSLADDIAAPGIIIDLTDAAIALEASDAAISDAATVSDRRRRRTALLAVGAGAFVVVAVLAAVVAIGGSDTGQTAIQTIAGVSGDLRFPAETTPWAARMTRVWSARDGGLHGELEFTNPTGATISGRHIEAIPKSLAANAALVASTPAPDEILQADPILAYDLTIDPGATTTVRYDIADIDVTDARLAAWRTEQLTALTGYQAATTTTSNAPSTTTPTVETVPQPLAVGPVETTVAPRPPGGTPAAPRETITTTVAQPPVVIQAPPTTIYVAPETTAVPLVARDDRYTAQQIPCGGVTQGGVCYAPLAMKVTANDSGPFTAGGYVTLPQYGDLLWDSALYQYIYQPQRTGPYTDTFTYRLSNKSGQVSNDATVTISVP